MASQEIPEEEILEWDVVENAPEVYAAWRSFRDAYATSRTRIENRWIGMRYELRRDLLNKHWALSIDSGSPMPLEHRPDLTQLVPWRDQLDKNRTLLPPRYVEPDLLRWPNFSLDKLTTMNDAFLELMYGRATEHPKEFAHVDHFGENAEIAELQFLLVKRRENEFDSPMVEIHTIDSEERGDAYGTVYYPSDPEDFQTMRESGLWLVRHAHELMWIQLRIYRFLNGVITEMTAKENEDRFRVDDEVTSEDWRPETPRKPGYENAKDDDEYRSLMETYRDNRDFFIENVFVLTPFISTLQGITSTISAICSKYSDDFEWKLQGIKGRPDMLFRLIIDVHDHSHYVLKGTNGETHPWADLTASDNDVRMWAKLLKESLYMFTESLDSWQTMMRTFEVIKRLGSDPEYQATGIDRGSSEGNINDNLALFYKMASDRLRLVDLRKTLACSRPLRQYFRKEGENANAEPRLVQTGSTNDIKNTTREKLLALLRVIAEPYSDQFIPHDRFTWAYEMRPLLDDENGKRWMTDFGDWQAGVQFDASFLWMTLKKSWDFDDNDELINPNDQKYDRWRDHKKPSDNLRAIDIEHFVTIVKKHMLPPPADTSSNGPSSTLDLFAYPDCHGNITQGKKRHNARLRRQAESRLKDLWADLQPMLESRGALSQLSIATLNQVRPTATRVDGADITPAEPPTPPPPVQRPVTPPGQSGTDPLVSPLRNFAINSPGTRPPPARTPERKAASGGISKISPIRRAAPGEGGPRRPQIDRRAERQILEAAAEAEPLPVVQAPQDDPAANVERPKIRLPTYWYQYVQKIMVPSGERNPAGIPWDDVCGIFEQIGFITPEGARPGVWVPGPDLARTQGIAGRITNHKPHPNPTLSFIAVRKLLRGGKGLGKYGWDFSKFEDDGT